VARSRLPERLDRLHVRLSSSDPMTARVFLAAACVAVICAATFAAVLSALANTT
jgi:hypothetical protein